jgi:hypothetical protein
MSEKPCIEQDIFPDFDGILLSMHDIQRPAKRSGRYVLFSGS